MKREVLEIKLGMCYAEKEKLEILRSKVLNEVDIAHNNFINQGILTASNFVGSAVTFTGAVIATNNLLSNVNNYSNLSTLATCTLAAVNIIAFPLFLREYNKNATKTMNYEFDRNSKEDKYQNIDQKIFNVNVEKNKIKEEIKSY